MMSVHCQVWNLDDDHVVTISRKPDGLPSSKMESIAWNDLIQQDVEERFFIATRRLEDGSVVFFMSVIDVVTEDSGIYYCKVLSIDPFTEIKVGSTKVAVSFFPAEAPVCAPNHPVTLRMGVPFVVNCSSSIGYPAVDLQWYRSIDEKMLGARQYNTSDNTAVSELEILPSRDLQDIVIVCHVTSVMFPDRSETCHIGPFHITPVLPNNDIIKSPPGIGDFDAARPTSPGVRVETAVATVAVFPAEDEVKGHCREVCPTTLNSPILHWIVATVFIGLLAFIFLIITIAISVRLCKPTSDPRDRSRGGGGHYQYKQRGHTGAKRMMGPEDVYEKLECRRDDQTVYMSLHRQPSPKKPDNLVVLRNTDIEGNYTRTPTVPIVKK